jgi:DNA-binding protein HU-beta
MANKKDLTIAVAEATGKTQKESKSIVDSITGIISGELKNGNPVKIVNFGKFSVVDRAARKGRNPQTGEALEIPAKSAIKFKAGKALVDAVQETYDEEHKNRLDLDDEDVLDIAEQEDEEISEIEDSVSEENLQENEEDIVEIN